MVPLFRSARAFTKRFRHKARITRTSLLTSRIMMFTQGINGRVLSYRSNIRFSRILWLFRFFMDNLCTWSIRSNPIRVRTSIYHLIISTIHFFYHSIKRLIVIVIGHTTGAATRISNQRMTNVTKDNIIITSLLFIASSTSKVVTFRSNLSTIIRTRRPLHLNQSSHGYCACWWGGPLRPRLPCFLVFGS